MIVINAFKEQGNSACCELPTLNVEEAMNEFCSKHQLKPEKVNKLQSVVDQQLMIYYAKKRRTFGSNIVGTKSWQISHNNRPELT